MNFKDYFGNAKWIGTGDDKDIPLIRQSFTAKAGEEAEITILGFGVFILYINGVRVHDTECLPLISDFEANDFPSGERLNHRAYVERFDISHLLRDGENVISVLLGNGWYNKPIWEESFGDGRKKVVYRIELESGEVLSDTTAVWVPSPTVDSHYNKGEDQDLRIDISAAMLPEFSGESHPVIVEDGLRESRLDTSDCPRDRVIRTLTPSVIFECAEYKLYDFGINTTGYPIVRVGGKCGDEIRISFSEDVTGSGDALDMTHAHDQRFNLISAGDGRIARPYFGWIAARYACVYGDAEILAFEEVRSDIAESSEFECDSEVINYIYKTYLHTQLTNMHTGIPSDCPQIERRGYTGDGQLVAHAAMMMTDSERFYRKWLIDISDCQDRISGHVQYTAPYTHAGGGPGGWGSAMVSVPYEFYKRFGDGEPMREMYPQMKEYLRYLDSHSENGLVISDREGEWCLGDWVTPDPVSLPAPFVNNYFYVKSCEKMIKIARLLGKEEDIPDLEARIALRRRATTVAYMNPWDGNFIGGVQAANAFAVDMGIGDGRTVKNMIGRYKQLGYLDTGIFGTDILIRLLFEHGEGELAVRLLTASEPHGFGRFMKENRTTLPEYWGDSSRSLSHPMFGAVTAYLFDYILGIRQTEESVGYESILIDPRATKAIGRASGSVLTARGERIRVAYITNNDGSISITASIPTGVSARVIFGGKDIPLSSGESTVTI